MEGKLKRVGRRRRRKQLLNDFKEKRRYWNVEEDDVDRTLCRISFGKGYEPVVRLTAR
jgi:hypothetical protein